MSCGGSETPCQAGGDEFNSSPAWRSLSCQESGPWKRLSVLETVGGEDTTQSEEVCWVGVNRCTLRQKHINFTDLWRVEGSICLRDVALFSDGSCSFDKYAESCPGWLFKQGDLYTGWYSVSWHITVFIQSHTWLPFTNNSFVGFPV